MSSIHIAMKEEGKSQVMNQAFSLWRSLDEKEKK